MEDVRKRPVKILKI